MLVLNFTINLSLLILDIWAVAAPLEELLASCHKVVNLVHFSKDIAFDYIWQQAHADMLGWGEVNLLLFSQLVQVIPVCQQFLIVVDNFLVFFGVDFLEVFDSWRQWSTDLIHLLMELVDKLLVSVSEVWEMVQVQADSQGDKKCD